MAYVVESDIIVKFINLLTITIMMIKNKKSIEIYLEDLKPEIQRELSDFLKDSNLDVFPLFIIEEEEYNG